MYLSRKTDSFRWLVKRFKSNTLEEHKKLNLRLENPKLLTEGNLVTKDYVTKFYLAYKIVFGIYFLVGFGIYLYMVM